MTVRNKEEILKHLQLTEEEWASLSVQQQAKLAIGAAREMRRADKEKDK